MARQVTLGPNDIRACCTLSRRYPRGGVTLTLGDLIELMMVESDNTACDAVLKLVGGPAAVERRLRAFGFNAINVNRFDAQISLEMTGVRETVPDAQWTLDLQRHLIAAVPADELREARARYTSDPRDTSTPDDMAALLVRLQRGDLLPWPYGDQLLDRMAQAKTGLRRLKARLPPETVVAHKTGTTDVVINDVGVMTLPENGGHLVLAVFVMNGGRVTAMQNVIADIAAAAYESFTGRVLPPPQKPVKAVKKKKRPAAR
jgi:beta-lactamase class A